MARRLTFSRLFPLSSAQVHCPREDWPCRVARVDFILEHSRGPWAPGQFLGTKCAPASIPWLVSAASLPGFKRHTNLVSSVAGRHEGDSLWFEKFGSFCYVSSRCTEGPGRAVPAATVKLHGLFSLSSSSSSLCSLERAENYLELVRSACLQYWVDFRTMDFSVQGNWTDFFCGLSGTFCFSS